MNIWTRMFAALIMGGALFLTASGSVEAFGHRRSCCEPPPQKVILQVCHPCTGCKYEVPVCIPACCTGVPSVCFQNTLIGNGKTVFTWNNGYTVVVRYPHGGGYRVIQHDLR